MEWALILNEIFQVCIIPLLGILTSFVIVFIKKKIDEVQTKTNNATAQRHLEILEEVIVNCVLATKQTYVDSLKDKNAFDAAAQKEAFGKTFDAVMATLTDETQKHLSTITSDLATFITEKIEAVVSQTK